MALKSEQLLYGVRIPLTKLEEYDNCPSPIALEDAFGDRYLCAHNPIFAAVRTAALNRGFRFSSADTPLWRDYLAFGLLTLDQILETRTIPYHSTRNTFLRLIKSNPKIALSPGLIINTVISNFALHESAHCVAHCVFEELDSDFAAIVGDEKQRAVIAALFEEAFAGTVERLGTLNEYHEISDKIFYTVNSHVYPAKGFSKVLNKAAETMDDRLRFTLLLFSSFEANLKSGTADEAAIERICRAAGCPPAAREAAAGVIETGFAFNYRFFEYTNPLYFDMRGQSKEYAAAAKIAWLDDAAHHPFFNRVADELFSIGYGADRKVPLSTSS